MKKTPTVGQGRASISALRIMALFVALAPSVILGLSLISGGFKLELLWLYLALAAAGALCGSFSLVGHTAVGRTVTLFALCSGILLGTAGFTLGYCRPELFGWHGNAAPLAGMFVTGPLGFVGGALAGLLVGCVRAVRHRLPNQNEQSIKPEPEAETHPEVRRGLRALLN